MGLVTAQAPASAPETAESSLPSACSAAAPQALIPVKYRGLCWEKKHQAWRVRIFYGGKQRHVGRYKDALEAARAYDKALVYLYGDKAKLNFTLAECLADPTEVSSFVVLAKHEVQQQQQQRQQHQPQQQRRTAAVPAVGSMLLQCNASHGVRQAGEESAHHHLAVLKAQKTWSPIHHPTKQQQQQQQKLWLPQLQLQAVCAGQQESSSCCSSNSNSRTLLPQHLLQQQQQECEQQVLCNNTSHSYTAAEVAAAPVVVSGVVCGPIVGDGNSSNTNYMTPAVLLQLQPPTVRLEPSAVDTLMPSSNMSQLNNMCHMSNNGYTLPLMQWADNATHSTAGTSNVQVTLVSTTQQTADMLLPVLQQQQQQPLFIAQQQHDFAARSSTLTLGTSSSILASGHGCLTPQTQMISPFQQQQQQLQVCAAPANSSIMPVAFTAVASSAPVLYSSPLQQLQPFSPALPASTAAAAAASLPVGSSCGAASTMARLLQPSSISQVWL